MYRHTKKIVSTFFVLIVFLIAFSESYSQEINPRFDECDNDDINVICNPNIWYSVTSYITHPTGCVIEVDYIWKNCTLWGLPYNKLEIVGWRLVNSPACNLLFNQLTNGGVFNEIKAREVQMWINEEITRGLFQAFLNNTNLSNLLPYYACDASTKPNSAPRFMQVFEATCMAMCVTYGYDDVVITVPGGGGPSPGLINPFQLPYNGRWYWINVVNKKCSESCCKIDISYCYDTLQNVWKRNLAQTSFPGPDSCPNNVTPLEICGPAPYLLPRVTNVDSTQFTRCTHTCKGRGEILLEYFD